MTDQRKLSSADIPLEKTSNRKTGSFLCPGQNQNLNPDEPCVLFFFFNQNTLSEFKCLLKLVFSDSDLRSFSFLFQLRATWSPLIRVICVCVYMCVCACIHIYTDTQFFKGP